MRLLTSSNYFLNQQINIAPITVSTGKKTQDSFRGEKFKAYHNHQHKTKATFPNQIHHKTYKGCLTKKNK